MRRSYRYERFEFTNPNLPQLPWNAGPLRIIIHRQGNPGAHARDALAWMDRTAAASIHCYIEEDLCIEAVPTGLQAWHVLEARVAQQRGWDVGPYSKPRGDFRAIGIETVDQNGGAPGQSISLSQDTRITLVICTAEYCQAFGVSPSEIYEHADLDPWTRSDDLGNAINLDDFREDVRDYIAGREPWRTVGQFATGARNTGSGPVPAPAPPVEPTPPPQPTPPTLSADEWASAAKRAIDQAVTAAREGR